MQTKYIVPVVLLGGCSIPSYNDFKDDPIFLRHRQAIPVIQVKEPLFYEGFVPGLRVDLTAYYFFLPEESVQAPCDSAVVDALSYLSLENKISKVYLPHFHRGERVSKEILPESYTSLAATNSALHFSGWKDDLTPGLNGTVYNHNTSHTESLFFNSLGDATAVRDMWETRGYAVVAPLALLDEFSSLVNSKDARPMMQLYGCNISSNSSN